ncbi:hypothetical protein CW693_01185 [Candidatus Bathyarchaeota archaeon]|nr:hypothetical protein [Candidatus Bathyarchaeota archaeon]RJS69909.1 MAG: hypothetical protein CW693_01185 [Candidatus Bathyarchaeota archaeon]RLI15108.1 MAG: hypothetical protein DRO41_04705 [Candidatus Bathyarchaeota archaeon]RLI20493.1 MAG: hypothetical protein DRO45_03640 [Candidatus Bathyarchaeota archaeon]
MNFIEILLSEKLKEKNPLLDVFGSDRKVLQIACKDLTNYLKVHWQLIGREENEYELADKIEEFYKENPKEMEEFLEVWTGMWLKKWNERVKLLIGNQEARRWNKVTKVLNKAQPLWRKLRNRHEMQEIVASTLIKNGEICGTSILAENLLKMELGGSKEKYSNDEELVLNVVNSTLRKARELSQSRGPLIFVKIDKGYYEYSQ